MLSSYGHDHHLLHRKWCQLTKAIYLPLHDISDNLYTRSNIDGIESNGTLLLIPTSTACWCYVCTYVFPSVYVYRLESRTARALTHLNYSFALAWHDLNLFCARSFAQIWTLVLQFEMLHAGGRENLDTRIILGNVSLSRQGLRMSVWVWWYLAHCVFPAGFARVITSGSAFCSVMLVYCLGTCIKGIASRSSGAQHLTRSS